MSRPSDEFDPWRGTIRLFLLIVALWGLATIIAAAVPK